MTCQHCCGAQRIFDDKEARKQQKRYRRKGPRKPSQKLISGILAVQNNARSVLDIGGGIGAVHLEMLKNGVDRATDIDASPAYIQKAKEESEHLGLESKVRYIIGDFLDEVSGIASHDVVVLDKVICCYPEVDALLDASLKKADQLIALVYPKSNFIGKIIIFMGNLYCRVTRNPFRVFLHSNELVRDKIRNAGFYDAYMDSFMTWNVEVFSRRS